MITHAEFQNYKTLRDVKLGFTPRTLIIGANGAGKSSVLNALRYLGRVANSGGQQWLPSSLSFDDPSEIYSRDGDGDLHLAMHGERTAATLEWSTEVRFYKLAPADGSREVQVRLKGVRCLLGGTDLAQGGVQESKRQYADLASGVASLRLVPQLLAAPSYSDAEHPRMQSDGRDLASALRDLRENDERTFESIVECVRQVVPHLRSIRPIRAKATAGDGRQVWGEHFDASFDGASNVPAHHLSEGTLFAIGLMTALHQQRDARTLLLDDVDRGLHPRAQEALVNVLAQLQQSRPELQVIATTHSPILLDYVRAEEVIVLALDAAGHTISARLSEHPEYERWRASTKPGEFWSFVGENWLPRALPGAAE